MTQLKAQYTYDELPEGVECHAVNSDGMPCLFRYCKTDSVLMFRSMVKNKWGASRESESFKQGMTFYPYPQPKLGFEEYLNGDCDFDFPPGGYISHPKSINEQDVIEMRKAAPHAIKFIEYHYMNGEDT